MCEPEGVFKRRARRLEGGVGAIEAVETLGDVVLSSGTLVVIDFGLLNFWSHSEPQHLEAGDPDLIERVNSAIDFEIIGPDARAVAAKIDLAAAKGTFVFDMPADSNEMVRERVAEI